MKLMNCSRIKPNYLCDLMRSPKGLPGIIGSSFSDTGKKKDILDKNLSWQVLPVPFFFPQICS